MQENGNRDFEAVRRRSKPDLFVIDADLNIVLSTQEAEGTESQRLPEAIEDAVRAAVLRPGRTSDGVAFMHESRTVRVLPAALGRMPLFFVLIERLRAIDSMELAMKNFGFTTREEEVLRQLMRGQSNAEIAETLGIGERTVGDHIKQIALKTEAHSRSKIVARVLGLG